MLIYLCFYLIFSLILIFKVTAITGKPDVNLGKSEHWRAQHLKQIPGQGPFDSSKFWVREGESVLIPSRHSGVMISGRLTEVSPFAPIVIIVHGIKPSSKYDASPLAIHALLIKAGFNTLRIDLQNYGESSKVDHFIKLGQQEYKDVLGAFDWLLMHGYKKENIGLAGLSLGAVTSAIAFSQEPDMPSLWMDSPFVDFATMCRYELKLKRIPIPICWGAQTMGKLILGVDPSAISSASILNKKWRPIFITHCLDDKRIPVQHSQQLVKLASDRQFSIQSWFPEGDHLQALFREPSLYQKNITEFFRRSLIQRKVSTSDSSTKQKTSSPSQNKINKKHSFRRKTVAR